MQLPTEILLNVFNKLNSPRDLFACCCVSKNWYTVASDTNLWLQWCIHYFVPPLPSLNGERENLKDRERERFALWTGPMNEKNPRKAFLKWWRSFDGFHELYPEMKLLASRLSQWLREHSQPTMLSLQPGKFNWEEAMKEMLKLTELEMTETEFRKSQELSSLKELFLFYHFHDGQKSRVPHIDMGLFGVCSISSQIISVFMYPSKFLKVIRKHDCWFLVFASCARSSKNLSIVLKAPLKELINQVVEFDENRPFIIKKGNFKEFLSQYIEDLYRQKYEVMPRDQSISIFPKEGENTSYSAQGPVKIRASALISFETSQSVMNWSYRIRMELDTVALPEGCQLVKKNWVIYYQSGHQEFMDSEKIPTMNPVLNQDQPVHQYAYHVSSRMHNNGLAYDAPVYMEGCFEFVPGSRARPLGDVFSVFVLRFQLPQPILLPTVQK